MGDRWRVVIEAWPYFGVEQAAAGDRSQTFYVYAENAREALTFAEHIVKGMEAGPTIWRAPIQSVALDSPVHRQQELPPVGKHEIGITEPSKEQAA